MEPLSRVAMVTGGASGMGRAICELLAQRGHPVAVADLDIPRAEMVAASLQHSQAEVMALPVDVADQDSVHTAVAEVRSQLGPIGILISAAGVALWKDFTDISLEEWNHVLAVNLVGTFLCIQAVIDDMATARWGRLITISAAGAQWGTARLTHYTASKGGVISLTKSLAREYGPQGITVNTVSPGPFDTPMSQRSQNLGDLPTNDVLAARLPLKRVGTVEEIAATCAYLASESAGYMTGQVVAVNGGMVI